MPRITPDDVLALKKRADKSHDDFDEIVLSEALGALSAADFNVYLMLAYGVNS